MVRSHYGQKLLENRTNNHLLIYGIALAFILVLSAFSKLLGYLNIENYTWSTSFLYLPILLVMVYAFNRSYGDLCEHFENEQKTE